MTRSCARRPARGGTTVLAVVLSLGGTPLSPALLVVAEAREETAVEAAHRRLREFIEDRDRTYRGWDAVTRPRLCELWLDYARAAGLPESTREYSQLQQSVPPELRGPTDPWIERAITRLTQVERIPCPPPQAQVQSAVAGAKDAKGRSPLLIIGGAVVAAGAAVALAAGGGGPSQAMQPTPPPATMPPADVTSHHGAYTGRLVTGNSTIAGCGRAAEAPCTAVLGGSPTGMPATLTIGGDLNCTGTLRANGLLESFQCQGPANGLAGLPEGSVITWQQQGTAMGNMLRLDGTATVTSPGRCNGAVLPTLVEAAKN